MGLEMGLNKILLKHRHRLPNAYLTASQKKQTDRAVNIRRGGHLCPPPQTTCIDSILATTTPPLVTHCKQIGCVSFFLLLLHCHPGRKLTQLILRLGPPPLRCVTNKLPTATQRDGLHDAHPPPIAADCVVADRCAVPGPQGTTTSSLLTILGAVKMSRPRDCSCNSDFC